MFIVCFFLSFFVALAFPVTSFAAVTEFVPQKSSSCPQLRYGDNFHTVEAGKLYRSAQLKSSILDQCIDHYKIGMVINLREKSDDVKTFEQEKKICEEKKIFFFNVPMNSYDLPSRDQINGLLWLYEFAFARGIIILIHCYAGVDRTGMAAALWVFQRLFGQGEDLEAAREKALKQLTIEHGSHLPEWAKVFFIKIWQGEEWFEKEYSPQKYQILYERYVSDRSCCECLWCCCDCCCGCCNPPCFFTSRYWEKQWGKLNLSC